MKRRNEGFSLLDLMVTLAVLATVLGVGVPSVAGLLMRVRVENTLHALTSALACARIEAIRRNGAVSVCPSTDGLACTGGTTWESGWIVFADASRSGQPATGADVLQVFQPNEGTLRVRATAGRRLVRFMPNGWSAGSNVTLRLCNGAVAKSEHVASIVVNNAGRVRSERPRQDAPCPYQ